MERLILLLVLGAVLSACGGEAQDPPGGKGPRALRFAEGTPLDASGAAVMDFGPVGLGRNARATIVLENHSAVDLPLEGFVVPPPFGLLDQPDSVPARARQSLVLTFSPEEAGGREASFVVQAGAERLTVHVRGEGIRLQKDCDFQIEPASIRLTADDRLPSVPWRMPVSIRTLAGTCVVDEVRTEGTLALEVESTEGRVLLPGTVVPLHFVAEKPLPGQEAEMTFRLLGKEATVKVEVAPEPACMEAEPSSIAIRPPLGCSETWEVGLKSRCEDAFGLLSTRLVHEEERTSFVLESNAEGFVQIRFASHDPLEVEEALAVLDFANGDRLYLPIRGEAHMEEERFVIPEPSIDLLVILDRGPRMEAYRPALEELAVLLSNWMEDPLVDVQVGVTSTVVEDGVDCIAERGRLLPLDGARPQIVDRDTPEREEVLRRNLQPEVCSGSGTSEGFLALLLALEGESFPFRNPARQRIVFFVTAEDESSPLSALDCYLEIQNRFGPIVSRVSAAAPNLAWCPEVGPTAHRYRSFVQHFLGTSWAICDQELWSRQVEEWKVLGRDRIRFTLQGHAEAEGRSLWADGKQLPEAGSESTPDWGIFSQSENPPTQVLHIAVGLAAGTEVTLRYAPSGMACAPGPAAGG